MLYYDFTSTFRFGRITGVQRVVKQLGRHLSSRLPGEFVTVTFASGGFYPCALDAQGQRTVHPVRQWLRNRAEAPFERLRSRVYASARLTQLKASLWDRLEQRPIAGATAQLAKGDWYFTADAVWETPALLSEIAALRKAGVFTAAVHYDLIPLRHPEWCPPASAQMFLSYARSLALFDVVFCISEQVKNEFDKFCREQNLPAPGAVATIRLGHEFAQSVSTAEASRAALPKKPFALCVATLDPRKNYPSLLDAFDALWGKGVDLSLVIVGAVGYRGDGIRKRILGDRFYGERLVWLSDCSDPELEQLYGQCVFTICASRYEGYGLPIVESLARAKPCICSDIPVFHETAGEFAAYVDPDSVQSIATTIDNFYSDGARLAARSRQIAADYNPPTWGRCAQVVLDGMGYGAASETALERR